MITSLFTKGVQLCSEKFAMNFEVKFLINKWQYHDLTVVGKKKSKFPTVIPAEPLTSQIPVGMLLTTDLWETRVLTFPFKHYYYQIS